jgi:hypothetical protein
MTSPDEELDDFLRRRRPAFRDDELEPPAELDRLVLRRARDAIEGDRPQRMFRAPAWGMPVALAATLMLVFTVILRVGSSEVAQTPEVTVQTVSRQIEVPPAASPPAAAPAPAAAMARPVAPAEASPRLAREDGPVVIDLGAGTPPASDATASATPAAGPQPDYRRDTQSWLAEIDRLRAAGDRARADAELAEFKREHRAYAGAPDR